MTLSNEIFARETFSILLLTLRYSVLALVISWFLALVFIYFRRDFIFSVFRFFWVLPGFAYALMTLYLLRALNFEHRYSMTSVCLAWVIAGVPYLAITIQTATRDLDFRQKEALESLGANRLRAFFEFEFLNTLPAQGFALLQQFWLYLTSFSLVMILSGGFPNETLEVGIYTSVRLDHVDFTRAVALGVWQMLILLVLRLALTQVNVRTGASEWKSSQGTKTSPRKSILFACLLGLVAACFIQFKNLETDGLWESLATSITVAVLVAGASLAWVIFLYRFKLNWVSELGAWVSPMLLTLFWWKAFAFTLLPLVNALVIQVLLFSPWMARTLYPLFKRARMAELEAAASLGCKPVQAWFAVEWPRVKTTVYFALALVVALSCTEVTAVILFAQNSFLPLAVWVQNSFLRFRLEEAMAGTLILVAAAYFFLSLGQERAEWD